MKKIFVIMFCLFAATAVVVNAQQVASNTSTNTAVSAYEPVARGGGVMPAAYERSSALLEGTLRFSGMGEKNEEPLGVCRGVKDPTCFAFASTKMEARLRSTPFDFHGGAKWLNGLHLSADVTYFGGHNVPQMKYNFLSMGPLAVEKQWSVSYTLPRGFGEVGFTQHPPLSMLQDFTKSPTYQPASEAMGGRYNAFYIEKSFSIGGGHHNSQ